MPFQTTVNIQPAPACEGDFASANPRAVALTPGGNAFVAGVGGVTIGRFGWADSTNTVVNSFGAGPVLGFVATNGNVGLISVYLAETSMNVPVGFPVTVHRGGDFWVRNAGASSAVIGQKVYANYATGASTFAATGTPPVGGTATASIAAGTFSVTASIATLDLIPIMTVTAVGSGTVVVGATISGTGVTSGTMVTKQLTGTAGGIGTYQVSVIQTTASTTVSGTYGILTNTAQLTGAYAIGDVLSGSGVTAGTYISALGTGTGGAGTYIVSPTQTAASTTISATGAVETKWYAQTPGAAGELIKISSQPLG